MRQTLANRAVTLALERKSGRRTRTVQQPQLINRHQKALTFMLKTRLHTNK